MHKINNKNNLKLLRNRMQPNLNNKSITNIIKLDLIN